MNELEYRLQVVRRIQDRLKPEHQQVIPTRHCAAGGCPGFGGSTPVSTLPLKASGTCSTEIRQGTGGGACGKIRHQRSPSPRSRTRGSVCPPRVTFSSEGP